MKPFTYIAVISSFFLLGATSALASDPKECARCDTEFNLSIAEYNCLKAKLPKLTERKTKFAFFRLSNESCGQKTSDKVRGSMTRLPSEAASAPKVYRLSRNQVTCLNENISKVQVVDGTYNISLVELCTPQNPIP